MAITLYNNDIEIQSLVAACVDDDGVVDTARLGALGDFTKIAPAVIAHGLNEQATIGMLKTHKAMIDEKIRKLEAQDEKRRAFIIDKMCESGITEIRDDNGLFKVTLSLYRYESVVLDDNFTCPPELCNEPKPAPPPTPSKSKIKAAIKAGEFVKGAEIVKSHHLSIK
jgi:hypothetical protein